MIEEIRVQDLRAETFIREKVAEIRAAVGEGTAINTFHYRGRLMIGRCHDAG